MTHLFPLYFSLVSNLQYTPANIMYSTFRMLAFCCVSHIIPQLERFDRSGAKVSSVQVYYKSHYSRGSSFTKVNPIMWYGEGQYRLCEVLCGFCSPPPEGSPASEGGN